MLALLAAMFVLAGRPATAWFALDNGTRFLPLVDAAGGVVNPNASATVSADVYSQLELARSHATRFNLLQAQNDTDVWKFNFNPTLESSFASRGAGGLAVLADRNSFPALVGTGVAFAMGFLEPCGKFFACYSYGVFTDVQG